MGFAAYLKDAADQYGICLSDHQISQFTQYYDLLIDWNQRVNLTAITDPQEVAVKHIIDSLSCYEPDYFSEQCYVVDVGTGAGFPGIPLKIYQPDIKLTLLDSLNKRLVFLQTVVEKLNLSDVSTVHARVEDAAKKSALREKFSIAVSRAVARLNVLSELCIPLVTPGGFFIALKGAQYRQEVDDATAAVNILGGKVIREKAVKLPGLEDVRAVIYIEKVANTPVIYPRRPGIPEKKPL